MLHLELQRGKEAMNGARFGKFCDKLGATAACVKRIVIASQWNGLMSPERRLAREDGKRDSYLGDSWFASVKAAIEVQEEGAEFFGPVKTAHSGFPLKELSAAMEDAPSGSYLVAECKEHQLFAVAYRYSLRSKSEYASSLTFVSEFRQIMLTFIFSPYVCRDMECWFN